MFPNGYFSSRFFPDAYWPPDAGAPDGRAPLAAGAVRPRLNPRYMKALLAMAEAQQVRRPQPVAPLPDLLADVLQARTVRRQKDLSENAAFAILVAEL